MDRVHVREEAVRGVDLDLDCVLPHHERNVVTHAKGRNHNAVHKDRAVGVRPNAPERQTVHFVAHGGLVLVGVHLKQRVQDRCLNLLAQARGLCDSKELKPGENGQRIRGEVDAVVVRVRH